MKMFAGTSRGVYAFGQGEAERVLESRGVRDLVAIGGRLFAGTGAGLYVSDDLGDTWALVGLADHEVWQVRAAPGNGSSPAPIYAGTQPAGLFRSDDGGDSWAEVESFAKVPEAEAWCVPVEPPQPGRARALVIDQHDPLKMWVGVEVGGIARSIDGGESWTVSLPGDNPDLHMMCAHPSDDGVLFASTGYGRFDGVAEMVEGNAGVFRSDDDGVTWDYAWEGITPRYSRPMCIDPRSPHALTVASAPNAFSSFKEKAGAAAMLFRSDDAGRSWHSLCDDAHSPSSANFHGLMPDPEIGGGVVVGTDTGEVWQVSDRAEWVQLGADMPAVLSLASV